jgi:hypothetical protein
LRIVITLLALVLLIGFVPFATADEGSIVPPDIQVLLAKANDPPMSVDFLLKVANDPKINEFLERYGELEVCPQESWGVLLTRTAGYTSAYILYREYGWKILVSSETNALGCEDSGDMHDACEQIKYWLRATPQSVFWAAVSAALPVTYVETITIPVPKVSKDR